MGDSVSFQNIDVTSLIGCLMWSTDEPEDYHLLLDAKRDFYTGRIKFKILNITRNETWDGVWSGEECWSKITFSFLDKPFNLYSAAEYRYNEVED